MLTAHNTSDETSHPDFLDYSLLDKKQSTTKPLPTNTQQSENRSTATTVQVCPPHHDSQDAVPLASQSPTVAQTAQQGPPQPKDKYQLLKDEYFRTRDENKQLRATIDNYDRELRRRNGEMNKANHYIQHLQHELQRSRDTTNGFQNELNNVRQQLEDAKTLSEVRGKELDLQHESHRPKDFISNLPNLINVHQKLDPETLSDFSTKTDELSISKVGDKVNALNEEIFQLAATIGEALIHKRHEVSQNDLDAAAAESQEMVGEKMTNILINLAQKPEPKVNPLLVQVVLQIFMVNFCVSKIQSWYPGDASIGEFLSAIYNEIHSNEEQAVSGRWRALTRAYTRPSTETWNKELYKRLQSVLIIASWAPRTPKGEEPYGNRLSSIFKAINELRMAIGEKFTSADLDIYVFKCDHNYVPGIMEDAYGDGRQSSDKQALETIVNTTGIGLGKVISGVVFTLLPAKIVLWSTLNEALDEALEGIQSTKKKLVKTSDGAGKGGGGPDSVAGSRDGVR